MVIYITIGFLEAKVHAIIHFYSCSRPIKIVAAYPILGFWKILRITQYAISPCPTVFRFHINHHSANQATNRYPYVAIPKLGEPVALKLICTEYPYVAIPKFGEPVALQLIYTEHPYVDNSPYHIGQTSHVNPLHKPYETLNKPYETLKWGLNNAHEYQP